ncbi:replication-relaxation family protein [Planctomycetota bacterium]
MRRPRERFHLEHLLQVNQFGIALETAAAGTPLRVCFINEHTPILNNQVKIQKPLQMKVVISTKGKTTLIPDAVCTISDGIKEVLFFLELDRGTEILKSTNGHPDFLKKIKAYLGLFDSKEYKNISECPGNDHNGFRVLVTAPDDARLNNLFNLSRDDPEDTHFFWFTCMENIRPDAILGNIWQSTSAPGHLSSIVPGYSP